MKKQKGISLIKKETFLPLKDKEKFNKILHDAFKYKRKNIRNNLKNYDLNKVLEVLNKYNYDLTVRAEELSLEIFVELANTLKNSID